MEIFAFSWETKAKPVTWISDNAILSKIVKKIYRQCSPKGQFEPTENILVYYTQIFVEPIERPEKSCFNHCACCMSA